MSKLFLYYNKKYKDYYVTISENHSEADNNLKIHCENKGISYDKYYIRLVMDVSHYTCDNAKMEIANKLIRSMG
jgi:hypothetical protein